MIQLGNQVLQYRQCFLFNEQVMLTKRKGDNCDFTKIENIN